MHQRSQKTMDKKTRETRTRAPKTVTTRYFFFSPDIGDGNYTVHEPSLE
jgi:hypothetical protein